MKKAYGPYKGWMLFIIPGWYKQKTAFFVVGPGPDPKVLYNDRATFDDAKIAGQKVLRHEADQ